MNRFIQILSGINQILNYLIFNIKKYKRIYDLRDRISLKLIADKYYNNYKKIILPFKEALPLVKYNENPILEEGKSEEWDEMGIREPFILFNGQKYLIYYESRTNKIKKDWQIGVATADKITGPWKKYNKNPILRYTRNDGDPDKDCVADPAVIYFKDYYHMFFDMFDGKTWRIGKAISKDGLNWEKITENGRTKIILDRGRKHEWDDKYLHCPEVYIWNEKLHMLYGAVGTGHSYYDTGLAIQKDENGEIFAKWGQVITDDLFSKNMILSRLQGGFILNSVIIAGLRIKKNNDRETTYMVFSDDGGKSWNYLSKNILNAGPLDEWDSILFYGPNCWLISERKLWTLYLGGKEENIRKLGLAYMKIPEII